MVVRIGDLQAKLFSILYMHIMHYINKPCLHGSVYQTEAVWLSDE